jgi:phytoene desaturase
MGPSLITAPAIIDRIFRRGGSRLEEALDLVPLDPFYRVYFGDDSHIDYSGDAERMRAEMARFSERDAAQYDAFMDAARPIYETVIEDGLGRRPFDRLKTLAGFLPRALKLGAHRSTAGFAAQYFEDFRHRFLFSFHPLFIGGNPFRAPAVYSMIPYLEKEQGVWYAPGGMYSLVEALESLFRRQGGEVVTGAEVTSIEVENGRARAVRTARKRWEADLVVSNADAVHTYEHLIGGVGRSRLGRVRMRHLEHSMSCFLLYLGVRRQFEKLRHHTIVLADRYEGLLTDIFDRKVLPEDFSMYLHAPTRTDPSMAPPGGESLYVLVPVPNLAGETDWERHAPAFEEEVIDRLESWGLTGLRANLEVRRRFSPIDFQESYNAVRGHAFGIEPKLSQTAYFRPANRSRSIDGLYLVGADTHPGAGVPGVMLSAESTEHAIREDLGVALPDQVSVSE